eukprot:jgi/Hompol1/4236/HPOL_001184-RA
MFSWYLFPPHIVNAASTLLRWSLGIVLWGIISYVSRRGGLIRFAALLQTKAMLALWGVFRVEDAIGWHDSGRSRWISFPFIIMLFLLTMLSQATEIFVLNFVPQIQGFAPIITNPSLNDIVPSIGISLTYRQFGGFCKLGLFVCNNTDSWWDPDYKLLVASLPNIAPSQISFGGPVGLAVADTSNVAISFIQLPLGSIDTTNERVSQSQLQMLSSIPLAINVVNDSQLLYSNARVLLPITDTLGYIVFNNTMILEQITWQVSGTGSNQQPSYMQAEVALQLNSAYTIQSPTGQRGFPNIATSWSGVLFSSANELGANASRALDSNTTVSAFGEYLCMIGNLGDGQLAQIIIAPHFDRASGQFTGFRYIAIDQTSLPVSTPHLFLSHSIVLSQVTRCRAYSSDLARAASDSFQWWLAACSTNEFGGDGCGTPVPQGLLNGSIPQPVGVIEVQATVINSRVCDSACIAQSLAAAYLNGLPSGSKQFNITANTELSSYYVPYELTVAWAVGSGITRVNSDQCWPGVCAQNGICSGTALPIWLIALIALIVISALLVFVLMEDLRDIVLYGFLQTTGPYGSGLAAGKGAFRSDTLAYLHTSQRQAYVGVRSRDTMYERARFSADPSERLMRSREGVQVTGFGIGKRLAHQQGIRLE